jgi:hypothetical protein
MGKRRFLRSYQVLAPVFSVIDRRPLRWWGGWWGVGTGGSGTWHVCIAEAVKNFSRQAINHYLPLSRFKSFIALGIFNLMSLLWRGGTGGSSLLSQTEFQIDGMKKP